MRICGSAEVDYFLREERKAMKALVDDLVRGAFTSAAPTVDQLAHAIEIDGRYSELGLGLVNASVVVLADDLGVRRLATRDVRDFAAVRLPDGSAPANPLAIAQPRQQTMAPCRLNRKAPNHLNGTTLIKEQVW